MHVVQVNYVFDPSLEGEELLRRYPSLGEWSEALLAAGASRVSVVQRARRDERIDRGGVGYRLCAEAGRPQPAPWTWPRRMHREVAALAPDVVHSHGLIFPVQHWQLRRALPRRVPLVVQDHAAAPPRPDPVALRRSVWRAGLRSVDAFLFTSARQAEPWRAAGLIAAEQPVYEVLEASRRIAPASVSVRLPGLPALLWVGRLNSNKDPLTALAGFEAALEALPQAEITFVFHGGDLLPQVEERAAAGRLAGRVHLRRSVPHEEMAALYGGADLFLLGSHHEGSGYALLEALACGLVPVVTDIPSFRMITGHGSIGALWPPGSAEGLRAALVAVAAGDRKAGRAAARAHFESSLSWPVVGRRAFAVYHEILARS
jgi:glycosyltransferase involved in cell wall biosynthesis